MFKDFTETSSLSDEELSKVADLFLETATPTILYSKNGKYTKEQMKQMFHLGYEYKVKGVHIDIEKTKPYSALKSMSVGDIILLPSKCWNATRTAASQLKKYFGCKFNIKKVTLKGEAGDIEVIRLL